MEREQQIELAIGGVGVVIAALTLFSSRSAAASSGGSGGNTGSPVSASALTAQVNTYNNDAAAVAEGITQAQESVANAGIAARAGAISAYTSASENQLSTLENAVTQQKSIAATTSASEYEAGLNALTSSYASHETSVGDAYKTYVQGAVSEAENAVNANAATNQTALITTSQSYQDNLNTQLARDQSNNGVTAQKIANTPSFGSVIENLTKTAAGFFAGPGLGNLTSFFSGGGGGSTPATGPAIGYNPTTTDNLAPTPSLQFGGL